MTGCEKMETPLISVIVPAYNVEEWIEECCKSVFSQTYPNIELIVVDDGSQDRTFDCLQKAAGNRQNVKIVHTENGGVCRARNTGLEASQGEFVAFLDADDMLLPDCLSFLYQRITNENCDIAIGQKVSVKSDGTCLEQHFPKESESWSGLEGLENSLREHPATYSVWGKLYRKSFLADVRFVEGRRVHEDSFFLFQCMLKQPRVSVSDRVVLRYRITENSASRAVFSDKFFDILYFSEEKRKLVQDCYPQYLDLAGNVTIKANMALLRLLSQTWEEKHRQAEKDCLQVIRSHRSSFIPATAADEKWFWLIQHHLYYMYKVYVSLKNRLKAMIKRRPS